MLHAGDKAPLGVEIEDAGGEPVSLKSLLGKIVVLYFYPKDNTPGCTVEACSFRDANREITKLGAQVIGVSKDKGVSHEKFTKKFELSFPLWSDPEHKLMEAFGTWGEKKFLGKTYLGTARATFVIDAHGVVIKVWEKVKPEGHAEEVLAFLKTL
jgi:peroxiredoxin Q/BCP